MFEHICQDAGACCTWLLVSCCSLAARCSSVSAARRCACMSLRRVSLVARCWSISFALLRCIWRRSAAKRSSLLSLVALALQRLCLRLSAKPVSCQANLPLLFSLACPSLPAGASCTCVTYATLLVRTVFTLAGAIHYSCKRLAQGAGQTDTHVRHVRYVNNVGSAPADY